MSVTVGEQHAERLAAARLRGAHPDELLDLADPAIEQAAAAADATRLELIAAELEQAAATHPETGNGLRIAAARARAALPPTPPTPAAARPADRGTAEMENFATWGKRSLAWLIDWCILVAGDAFLRVFGSVPVSALVWTVVAFGYFALLNGQGSTLGKWLFGIKVVDAATGAPIGAARGATREAVRLGLTIVTLGIGLILDSLRPLWNEKHQSWHDAVAQSIVVQPRPRVQMEHS